MILTRLSRSVAAASLGLLLVAAACSRMNSSTAPSEPTATTPAPATPAPTGIVGTWDGIAVDSDGAGQMVWSLTQAANGFSGTVMLVDFASGVHGAGTVTGTLSGDSLTFQLNIPVGGFDGRFSACSATVAGAGTLAGTTLTGTYAGNNSCSGSVSSGSLTLGRQ